MSGKVRTIYLMTKEEAAQELGCSTKNLDFFKRLGTGPTFRFRHGRNVFCSRNDFENFRKLRGWANSLSPHFPARLWGPTMASAKKAWNKHLAEWCEKRDADRAALRAEGKKP